MSMSHAPTHSRQVLVAEPTSVNVLQAADTVKQQASQLASSKAQLQEATAAQKVATEVRLLVCACLLSVHVSCLRGHDAWY